MMMKTSAKRQLHYGPLRLARGILAHGSFVVVSFLALLIVQSCAGNHVDSTPEDSLAADGAPGGRSDGGTDSGRVGETDTGPGIEPVEIPDLYVLSKGLVHEVWGGSAQLSAFDSNSSTPYGDCTDEVAGTETCPSIDWEVVPDPERDNVLEVRYLSNAGHAGIVVGPAPPVELSAFSGGSLSLDIKVIDAGGDALSGGFFIKVESGGDNSGELPVAGIMASGEWESVSIPVAALTASGALNITGVTVPMVFFPAMGTAQDLVYQIDNVRFSGADSGSTGSGGPVDPNDSSTYEVTSFGAGSVSDSFNPQGYGCVYDYGHWIYNAGVVEPGVNSCDPIGPPTPLAPQVVGAASEGPVPTHRWWGSLSFLGEMEIGNPQKAAYITPDPLTARISNKGVRVMGIPPGLGPTQDGFLYQIPDPFAEVFDGIAIGNTAFGEMEAYLADSSDSSVTVQWQNAGLAVMEATLVHGSPYIYFKAYQGDLVVRTLRIDGPEKGTFYSQGNSLGIWTDVAGNRNCFLVTGEGDTSFSNISGDAITVSNSARELTLTYLPTSTGLPSDTVSATFASLARNVVASVDTTYSVDPVTHIVTISHAYRDGSGQLVETLAGMHPLHWKRSSQPTTGYQVRSARGTIKYSQTSQFSYEIPFVGVLPYLPSTVGDADPVLLKALVTEFVSAGEESWNSATDTYWAGKNYHKVAELAAIARSIGMSSEAEQLVAWLKAELSDWFTADTDGVLDQRKYFVYDDQWNALLGVEEAFQSHQQLNDHHFHYGYFVRAAAEVCRVDPNWCGDDHYGPMVELLIRDYAGGRDDPMFPYLRHFDPANGFSWASGAANFALGNNNESTSEAANAYGAIVLYGLTVGDAELVNRGIYLHASTTSSYWEYWANLDRYRELPEDYDNFPNDYDKLTTSIVWGLGAVFATWFSPATAHILGIQGLPVNALTLHVGLYADYMADYVTLGLSESSNGKPSGLADDQWRDIWWSLWALTDADAAIADYQTVDSDYVVEAGETKAHTYHWLHAFRALGHLKTGTGTLTSDHPAALAFEKAGTTTYVVYNFTNAPQTVSYSDGHAMTAAPLGFTITSSK